MDKKLLDMLICPATGEPLTIADDALIAKINEKIQAGGVQVAAGRPVDQPIDGGLIGQAGKAIYPIRDDIPILLQEEAILLESIGAEQ